MRKVAPELKMSYLTITAFFTFFLMIPLGTLLWKSFSLNSGMTLEYYKQVLAEKDFIESLQNSLTISLSTALITTVIALILVVCITETRLPHSFKKIVKIAIMVPMLLPTLTYGFSIMYAYGKQGLITRLFGIELFQIYGFWGMLMGYVIYTLPGAFLLIYNAAGYVDRKFSIVSKLMGDNGFKTFVNTFIRPLVGAIGGAFVLSFVLSFTDYGIPAALGGTYSVLSTKLYDVMLGSIPNMDKGAVVAMILLVPAAFGFMLLNYLERFNFHYDRITSMEISKNIPRDLIFGSLASFVLIIIAGTLSVILIMPFVKDYPYNCTFSIESIKGAFGTNNLLKSYQNTLWVALLTALAGTLMAYMAALINTRSKMATPYKRMMDIVSMLCNTVPGMVIGVSYLLVFNTSGLKGTIVILVICNIVHFFTTPYLMAKNSLSKMNPGWETAALLMGDSWIKTITRVILPNTKSTIIEMFSYYFVNSMVTVSAIIFLVSTRSILVTAKIKELQYFDRYAEVFVLSLLILITNLIVKALAYLSQNPINIGLSIKPLMDKKGE